MEKPSVTMQEQIAQAASSFQQERTGVVPGSVNVVLNGDTLVITLHGALSPAEKALCSTPEGAVHLQDFHRQLFANSSASLRAEIQRITGVEVREASAEVATARGSIVQIFTTGAIVQVFQLASRLPTQTWCGNGQGCKP